MSQQINLFNPIFLKQKKYFSTVTMVQGLGMVVLGSVLFYFYALYQVAALRSQAGEGAKLLESEQARLAKFSNQYGAQQKSVLLEGEVKQLEARLKARQEVTQTLKSGAIGNTDGYSEYMRAFARQSLEGLWLTGFSISGAGSDLSLAGRVLQAELVPDYLQRLNRERLLQGKPFGSLQIRVPKDADKNGLSYLEFSLQSAAFGDGKAK